MEACPRCRFKAKTKSGLASHVRAKHPREEVRSSVAQAVLADLDRVQGAEGLRSSALALARAIDETFSPRDLASLARELRATLGELGVEPDTTEEPQTDGVDELERRRAARRAAASDPARP